MKRLLAPVALGLCAVLGLAACNPYDPGQRALGGAALGAGTGALVGVAAGGGGRGAATGALIGGGVGAIGGLATTPQAPPPGYYNGYPQGPYQGYPPPAGPYQGYPPPQGYYQPEPRY